ncbi:hypothetical protein HanPSC8_Chr15g0656891 [Helianthus annuus]|nr:hypothetical protein HanPSC8_Chr15g0656891 [Helianthus annuus]
MNFRGVTVVWRSLWVEFAAVVFERGGGERWWSNRMWAGPR